MTGNDFAPKFYSMLFAYHFLFLTVLRLDINDMVFLVGPHTSSVFCSYTVSFILLVYN